MFSLRSSAYLCVLCVLLTAQTASAQETLTDPTYNALKTFALTGGAIDVKGLTLKKDRVQFTLDGVVYLSEPINGLITGAVFIGKGNINVETPPGDFEKENLKRLLGVETFTSDFETAVFRFTDDTGKQFGKATREVGVVNEHAQTLAREMDDHMLRQNGLNLSARLAISLLNAEKPGFFIAHLNGGKRGRFSIVLDHQTRIPVANFTINAGEKGVIWSYDRHLYSKNVWLAFHSLEDYQRGSVPYSEANDQIDIKHYRMDADLRDYQDRLRLNAQIIAEPLQPNVRAITFSVGENLTEYKDHRLKKQMRVTSVRRGGNDLPWVQEDWEAGFTVFLPDALKAREKLELNVRLEGDYMWAVDLVKSFYYPLSNTSWYPRHGYLDRATFDLTFRHPKKLLVASVGARTSEADDPEDKDGAITKYRMEQPVALVTFALGPFKRHTDTIKWEHGGTPIPVEFSSVRGSLYAIKEDFILAELNNTVRYFTILFGEYPYPAFGAAFHPFVFGQGIASLLMIPKSDRDSKYTYRFIAHETAHQWWGNIVAWRSYRDQWLSEGFAEYSGVLYTGVRDGLDSKKDLLERMRSAIRNPPITLTGPGKGRLVDVGPIILGHRLSTEKTRGAYATLIYSKGALVLRMLHFMFTDPDTGDGQPFFTMMTDFVERHRNSNASSDDFRAVANEHFAKSAIARKHKLSNLNWLFYQAVYQTALPSYELRYKVENQPDGKAIVSGTILQKNAPQDWMMVLPVKFSFGDKQTASGTVLVQGPSSTFQIRLPRRPKNVELDPERWILAEGISTKGN